MSSPKSRLRAFSLVEILVVLSLAMLLAALLFPAFSRARESNRRSKCQSNLQQIGRAIQTYSQDYDGEMPLSTGRTLWMVTMDKYFKSKSVLLCPSQNAAPPPVYSVSNYHYNWERVVSFNGRMGEIDKEGTVHESVIQRPSEIVLFREEYDAQHFPVRQVRTPASCPITYQGRRAQVLVASSIHSGGSNYLFFDGHVKWLLPDVYVDLECKAGPWPPAMS